MDFQQTTEEIYSTEEEWLNARVISSTRMSAILGKSKFMTKTRVYEEIVNHKQYADSDNELMQRGRNAEPLVRSLFAIDVADKYEVIDPIPFALYRRKDKPYLTATPDGFMKDKKTGELGCYEGKRCELWRRDQQENWEAGKIPDEFFIQCLWYFVVIPEISFVYINGHLIYHKCINDEEWVFDYAVDKPYKIVKKDTHISSYVELLENEATKFYENHIVAKVPPKRGKKNAK